MNFRLRHLLSLTLVSLQTMIPLVGAATYGPHPYWDADNNVYDLGGIPLRINSGAIIGSGNLGIGVLNPGYRVDVDGYINSSSGFCINGNCIANWNSLLPSGSNTGVTLRWTGIGWSDSNSEDLFVNGVSIGVGNDNSNVLFGFNSLLSNTSGYENVAIGSESMLANISGDQNTAIGAQALTNNIDGWENTAIGFYSLASNTSGKYNTVNGTYAANSNSIGEYNTVMGYMGMENNTSGSYNTAIGLLSLGDNGSGTYNTAIGTYSDVGFSNLVNASALGSYAYVRSSNTMVLGSVNGVNGATSDVQVVLGSGAASSGIYRLDVQKGYINTSSGLCINGDCKSAWNQVGGSSLAGGTTTGNVLRWTGTGWSDSNSGDLLVNGVTIGRGTGVTTGNLVTGINSLSANIAGVYNTAFGDSALQSNTNGGINVAIGHETLRDNTLGDYNTAIGAGSLKKNILGDDNVGIGANTLGDNLNGYGNIGIGNASLRRSTGNNNIGIGADALWDLYNGNENIIIGSATTISGSGSNNILIGNNIGYASGTQNALNIGGWLLGSGGYISIGTGTSNYRLDVGNGYINSASGLCMNGDCKSAWNQVGGSSLASGTTTGNTLRWTGTGWSDSNDGDLLVNGISIGLGDIPTNDNLIFGYHALFSSSGVAWGDQNIAIGSESLYSNTNGYKNVAIGGQSLWSNTTGYENVALGNGALFSNTTGWSNSAIGIDSLSSNTVGINNTGFGYATLAWSVNGDNNTANGAYALANNVSGGNNTAVGLSSMEKNTAGGYNAAIGVNSLYYNTIGNMNAALGSNALYLNTLGDGNTALGYAALVSNTTGSGNIGIGAGSDVASDNLFNAIAIGHYSLVSASNTMVLGSTKGVGASVNDTQVVIGSGAASSGVYRLDVQKGYINTSSGLCINGDCKSAWSEIVGGSSFWSDIGSGNIAYTSGMIGIGTNNPQSILDISGTVSLYGNRFVTYLKDGYSFGIGPNALNPLMGAAGQNNIGIGIDSLSSIDGGRHNVGLGNTTLMNLTSGRYNTALGSNSLWSTSLGWNNVGVGVWSLSSNTEGTSNVGIGMNSLYSNVLGNNNSALGYNAGYNNINGNYNLYLGYYADSDLLAPNLENATAIGPFSSVAASNTMVLGSVNGVNGATADTQVVIGSGAASNSVYRLDVQKGYINSSSGLCINGDCKSSWVPDGKNDQYLKKILIYGGERDNTIRTTSQTLKTIKTIDGDLMNFSSITCPVGTTILGDFFVTYTDSITNGGNPNIELKYSDNGALTIGLPASNTQQTKYKTVVHKITNSAIRGNNTDDMTLDISVFMGNEATEYFELSRIELGIYCGEEVIALP